MDEWSGTQEVSHPVEVGDTRSNPEGVDNTAMLEQPELRLLKCGESDDPLSVALVPGLDERMRPFGFFEVPLLTLKELPASHLAIRGVTGPHAGIINGGYSLAKEIYR